MQASGSPLVASVRENRQLSAGPRATAYTVTDRECYRLSYPRCVSYTLFDVMESVGLNPVGLGQFTGNKALSRL